MRRRFTLSIKQNSRKFLLLKKKMKIVFRITWHLYSCSVQQCECVKQRPRIVSKEQVHVLPIEV